MWLNQLPGCIVFLEGNFMCLLTDPFYPIFELYLYCSRVTSSFHDQMPARKVLCQHILKNRNRFQLLIHFNCAVLSPMLQVMCSCLHQTTCLHQTCIPYLFGKYSIRRRGVKFYTQINCCCANNQIYAHPKKQKKIYLKIEVVINQGYYTHLLDMHFCLIFHLFLYRVTFNSR